MSSLPQPPRLKTLKIPVRVEAAGARATFTTWLERGDVIGVFQNCDLGHPNAGHLVFLPITPEEVGKVTAGVTKAPDNPLGYGLGWRYVLQGLCEALDLFQFGPTRREYLIELLAADLEQSLREDPARLRAVCRETFEGEPGLRLR